MDPTHEAQEEREVQVATGLKAPPSAYERWKAAAAADRLTFALWARRHLDAAAAGIGPERGPVDTDLEKALEALQIAYGVLDPRQLMRMAVLAAFRRYKAGLDAFLLHRPEGPPKPAEATPPSQRRGSSRPGASRRHENR